MYLFIFLLFSAGPNILEKLIHNVFDVFDTARIQEVDVRDLGTMIRALGKIPISITPVNKNFYSLSLSSRHEISISFT